jgi:hypothetical protein
MRVRGTVILILLFCIPSAARGDFAVPPGTVRVEAVFGGASLVCNCLVDSVVDHTYPIEIRGNPSTRHEVTARTVIQDLYKSDDLRVTNLMVHYVVDEQQGQRVAGSRLGLSKGEVVLLFLTKTRTDSYEFADPLIGATQFSSLPVEDTGFARASFRRSVHSLSHSSLR